MKFDDNFTFRLEESNSVRWILTRLNQDFFLNNAQQFSFQIQNIIFLDGHNKYEVVRIENIIAVNNAHTVRYQ